MENREQQILSEIKSMMSSIRMQLEQLDAKMAELQQVVDPDDVSAIPIDLDIVENDVLDACTCKCLGNVESDTVRCAGNPSVLTF